MKKLEGILKGISLFCLYYLLTIIVPLIYYNGIKSSNSVISNGSLLLSSITITIIFVFIFKDTIKKDIKDFKKDYIKNNFKYYLLGLLIMVISNMILNSFISIPTNEALNREYLSNYLVYSIISLIICAPISEELISRIAFKKVINKEIVYLLITGTLFGLMHVISFNNIYELFYIIPYSALGISLSKIYYNSNNIFASMFFHSMHNTLAILLLFLGGI